MRSAGVAAWVVGVLSIRTLSAGEHLITPAGENTEGQTRYELVLRQTLLRYAPDVPYARMMVLPSFSPEWMIDLHEPVGGKSAVRLVMADSEVWPLCRPRSVTTQTAQLKPRTAALVHSLWNSMVSAARPPSIDDYGLDGTSYRFFVSTPMTGSLAAEVWSPPGLSNAGRLAALGESLRLFVLASDAERPAIEEYIVQRASELQHEIPP